MEQDNKKTESLFMEAYEQYNDAIFRYCLFQVSNREQALDLAQDTFTKTWEYLVKGGKIDNVKAFLYRIATNAIIDYRRKKKSGSLDALMDVGFDTQEQRPVDHESQSDGEIVRMTLAELDEKYRDVLTMRYINELSVKEIAESLGESENNVSVRIHRGIAKMKDLLEKRELAL